MTFNKKASKGERKSLAETL